MREELAVLTKRVNIPLYKNAVYLMGNSAAMAASGFFAWVIAARFYSAESVGLATATIAAISLLAVISNFGFGAVIIRYLEKAESQRSLINTCLIVSSLAAAGLGVIFICGTGLWSPELSFLWAPGMAMIFVGCTILWSMTWLLDSVFVAYRRADKVFWKNGFFSAAKLVLPMLLVGIAYGQGIVLGWGLGLLIGVVIAVGLWMPKLNKGYNLSLPRVKVLSETWRYSLGSYLVLLLKNNPGLILPLLVLNIRGPETNAYFYIAWIIGVLLFSIPAAVGDSLFAEGSHLESKMREHTVRALKFALLLVIPAAIAVWLLADWVLGIFGEAYAREGLVFLRILALSAVPVALTAVYESVLRVKNRLKS